MSSRRRTPELSSYDTGSSMHSRTTIETSSTADYTRTTVTKSDIPQDYSTVTGSTRTGTTRTRDSRRSDSASTGSRSRSPLTASDSEYQSHSPSRSRSPSTYTDATGSARSPSVASSARTLSASPERSLGSRSYDSRSQVTDEADSQSEFSRTDDTRSDFTRSTAPHTDDTRSDFTRSTAPRTDDTRSDFTRSTAPRPEDDTGSDYTRSDYTGTNTELTVPSSRRSRSRSRSPDSQTETESDVSRSPSRSPTDRSSAWDEGSVSPPRQSRYGSSAMTLTTATRSLHGDRQLFDGSVKTSRTTAPTYSRSSRGTRVSHSDSDSVSSRSVASKNGQLAIVVSKNNVPVHEPFDPLEGDTFWKNVQQPSEIGSGISDWLPKLLFNMRFFLCLLVLYPVAHNAKDMFESIASSDALMGILIAVVFFLSGLLTDTTRGASILLPGHFPKTGGLLFVIGCVIFVVFFLAGLAAALADVEVDNYQGIGVGLASWFVGPAALLTSLVRSRDVFANVRHSAVVVVATLCLSFLVAPLALSLFVETAGSKPSFGGLLWQLLVKAGLPYGIGAGLRFKVPSVDENIHDHTKTVVCHILRDFLLAVVVAAFVGETAQHIEGTTVDYPGFNVWATIFGLALVGYLALTAIVFGMLYCVPLRPMDKRAALMTVTTKSTAFAVAILAFYKDSIGEPGIMVIPVVILHFVQAIVLFFTGKLIKRYSTIARADVGGSLNSAAPEIKPELGEGRSVTTSGYGSPTKSPLDRTGRAETGSLSSHSSISSRGSTLSGSRKSEVTSIFDEDRSQMTGSVLTRSTAQGSQLTRSEFSGTESDYTRSDVTRSDFTGSSHDPHSDYTRSSDGSRSDFTRSDYTQSESDYTRTDANPSDYTQSESDFTKSTRRTESQTDSQFSDGESDGGESDVTPSDITHSEPSDYSEAMTKESRQSSHSSQSSRGRSLGSSSRQQTTVIDGPSVFDDSISHPDVTMKAGVPVSMGVNLMGSMPGAPDSQHAPGEYAGVMYGRAPPMGYHAIDSLPGMHGGGGAPGPQVMDGPMFQRRPQPPAAGMRYAPPQGRAGSAPPTQQGSPLATRFGRLASTAHRLNRTSGGNRSSLRAITRLLKERKGRDSSAEPAGGPNSRRSPSPRTYNPDEVSIPMGSPVPGKSQSGGPVMQMQPVTTIDGQTLYAPVQVMDTQESVAQPDNASYVTRGRTPVMMPKAPSPQKASTRKSVATRSSSPRTSRSPRRRGGRSVSRGGGASSSVVNHMATELRYLRGVVRSLSRTRAAAHKEQWAEALPDTVAAALAGAPEGLVSPKAAARRGRKAQTFKSPKRKTKKKVAAARRSAAMAARRAAMAGMPGGKMSSKNPDALNAFGFMRPTFTSLHKKKGFRSKSATAPRPRRFKSRASSAPRTPGAGSLSPRTRLPQLDFESDFAAMLSPTAANMGGATGMENGHVGPWMSHKNPAGRRHGVEDSIAMHAEAAVRASRSPRVRATGSGVMGKPEVQQLLRSAINTNFSTPKMAAPTPLSPTLMSATTPSGAPAMDFASATTPKRGTTGGNMDHLIELQSKAQKQFEEAETKLAGMRAELATRSRSTASSLGRHTPSRPSRPASSSTAPSPVPAKAPVAPSSRPSTPKQQTGRAKSPRAASPRATSPRASTPRARTMSPRAGTSSSNGSRASSPRERKAAATAAAAARATSTTPTGPPVVSHRRTLTSTPTRSSPITREVTQSPRVPSARRAASPRAASPRAASPRARGTPTSPRVVKQRAAEEPDSDDDDWDRAVVKDQWSVKKR